MVDGGGEVGGVVVRWVSTTSRGSVCVRVVREEVAGIVMRCEAS